MRRRNVPFELTLWPERLASLLRSLSADDDERSGEPNHGASTAETSRRVDRRGRRGTPQPDSGDHRVRMRWPPLPVILTSGYPRESGGELPPDVPYMPKPLAAVQSADRRRTGTDIAGVMRLP